MLNDFVWLRNNAYVLCDSASQNATPDQTQSSEDWHSRCQELRGRIQEYWTLVQHLRVIPNQAIFADLLPYVQDLQNTLAVVYAFLQWMASVTCTMLCRFVHGQTWSASACYYVQCAPLQANG